MRRHAARAGDVQCCACVGTLLLTSPLVHSLSGPRIRMRTMRGTGRTRVHVVAGMWDCECTYTCRQTALGADNNNCRLYLYHAKMHRASRAYAVCATRRSVASYSVWVQHLIFNPIGPASSTDHRNGHAEMCTQRTHAAII